MLGNRKPLTLFGGWQQFLCVEGLLCLNIRTKIDLKKTRSSFWNSLLLLSCNVCHLIYFPKEKLIFYFLLKGGQRAESFKKIHFRWNASWYLITVGEPLLMNWTVAGILCKIQLELGALEIGKARRTWEGAACRSSFILTGVRWSAFVFEFALSYLSDPAAGPDYVEWPQREGM